MNVRTIILSWDTFVSIIITLLTAIFLPTSISSAFALSFYGVGINVLSIIFALFFASSAIIMTSSDDDFIEFLEVENDFTALLDTFKITLFMLFVSLVFAIILYIGTDYLIKKYPDGYAQSSAFFLILEFVFSYSLIATALSARDTIRFSSRRAIYLMQQRNRGSKQNHNSELPKESN